MVSNECILGDSFQYKCSGNYIGRNTQYYRDDRGEENCKKLEELCSDISFPELPNDLEIYALNVDSYLNKKKRDFLGYSLLTEEERTCFINEYFARNPDHLGYKSYILPILYKFLARFEELVLKQLTPAEKILVANEKRIQHQLDQVINILDEQEVTAQVFSANKLYSDSFNEVLFLHRNIPDCKVTLWLCEFLI